MASLGRQVWTAGRIRELAEAGHWGALEQMATTCPDRIDRRDHRHAGPDGGPLAVQHPMPLGEDRTRKRLAEVDRALGEG